MAEKRKDGRGRNLKDGEDQMPDGRYRYRYKDKNGNRQAIYSWRLVPTDKLPPGKRTDLSLREKITNVERDNQDGIDGKKAAQISLNDMWNLYISGKYELKQSTRGNYLYMFKKYVSEDIGKKKIAEILDFSMALLSGFPFRIRTAGRVDSRFLSRGKYTRRKEDTTSKVTRVTMGIIACERGIEESVIGKEAISEMRSVVMRSVRSSSPICLFPISRIDIIKTRYIITVLKKIVTMSAPKIK